MIDPLRDDCATAAAYMMVNLVNDNDATEDELIAMFTLIVGEAIKRYVAERGARVHQQSAN